MATTYEVASSSATQAEVNAPKPSLFRTFFNPMIDARQQQADEAVVRHLTSSGGKFTDSTEFAMERVLSGRTCIGFVR